MSAVCNAMLFDKINWFGLSGVTFKNYFFNTKKILENFIGKHEYLSCFASFFKVTIN